MDELVETTVSLEPETVVQADTPEPIVGEAVSPPGGLHLPPSVRTFLMEAANKHGSRKGKVNAAGKTASGKTFFYGRFSTGNQHESSIDRQLERATHTARLNGFEFDEMFVDRGVTGASFEREGLSALIEALRLNPRSRVFVEDMSRLCRTVEAYCNIYLPLLETGTELWDVNGPVSELMGPIQAAIASYDRTNIISRMKTHRHKFMEEGRYMSAPPFGYDKNPKTKKLVIDPSQADLVVDLFNKRAGGATLGSLLRDLNSRGVPTPAGARHWHRSSLSRILTNPIYAGLTVYNVGDRMIVVETPETVLVDPGTFAKVEALHQSDVDRFNSRTKTERSPRLRKFLLSGKITCPHCGSKMLAAQDRRGDRRLRCQAWLDHALCASQDSYSLRQLERHAIDGAREFLLSSNFNGLFMAELKSKHAVMAAEVEADRQRLSKSIASLDEEIDGMLNNALMDDERFALRIKAKIQEKQDKLDRLVAKLNSLPQIADFSLFEDTQLPALKDSLDDMWRRAPFVPVNVEEERVRDLFQAVVRTARLHDRNGDGFSVTIDYDFGAALDFPDPALAFSKIYRCAYEYDPKLHVVRRQNTRILVEEGNLALDDEEFRKLVEVPEIFAFFERVETDVVRRLFDAMTLVVSVDTNMSAVLEAYGLPVTEATRLITFRQSIAGTLFQQTLADLRPHMDMALKKLSVPKRPSRYLRTRFAKLQHPVLKLSLCDLALPADHKLSDEQWAIIRPLLPTLKKPRLNVDRWLARQDFDALFRVIRTPCSWAALPAEYLTPSNIAMRMEQLFKGGEFNQIVGALLAHEGIDLDGPLPDIPKMTRNKR
jgi:DNA invertase Pin-like site-specific DNA recombinase